MTVPGDHWADKDVQTLREIWPDHQAIAERIGRTLSSVIHKGKKLGLRTPRETFWNDEREDLVRNLWPTFSAGQIAQKLGFGITRSAVMGKASRLGLSKHDIK